MIWVRISVHCAFGLADEDTTSTSTPAAPSLASPDAPPPQAPPSGPITRARARELNFVMLLKNEGPEEALVWAPRVAPSSFALDTRGGAPSPGRPSLGAAPPLPLFIEKFLFNSDLSFVYIYL